MTIHNELAQAPEILRAYLLATGLAENEEGVVRLGETLTPIVDIWSRPEWQLLRGQTPWGFNRVVAAGGAGTNAAVAVGNQSGSGIVTVIEKIQVELSTVAQIGVMMRATDTAMGGILAGLAQVNTRDSRRSATARTAVRYGTPAGLFAGTEMEYQHVTIAGTIIPFNHLPIMLFADQALLIQTNTANVGISVSASGYERKCVLNEARG